MREEDLYQYQHASELQLKLTRDVCRTKVLLEKTLKRVDLIEHYFQFYEFLQEPAPVFAFRIKVKEKFLRILSIRRFLFFRVWEIKMTPEAKQALYVPQISERWCLNSNSIWKVSAKYNDT